MATEKRLIDANALIDDWNKIINCMVRDSDGKAPVDFGLVICELSKVPTVDAVEVVRCNDCKYHDRCDLEKLLRNFDHTTEQYCSAGERKDND